MEINLKLNNMVYNFFKRLILIVLIFIQIFFTNQSYAITPASQIQTLIEVWNQQNKWEDLKSDHFINSAFAKNILSESDKNLWKSIIADSLIEPSRTLPKIEFNFTKRYAAIHFSKEVKKLEILTYQPLVFKTGNFEVEKINGNTAPAILADLKHKLKSIKEGTLELKELNKKKYNYFFENKFNSVKFVQIFFTTIPNSFAQYAYTVDEEAAKKQQKQTMIIIAAGVALAMGTVGVMNWQAGVEKSEKKQKKELPLYEDTVDFIKSSETQNKIKYQALTCDKKGVSELNVYTENPKGKLEISYDKKKTTQPKTISFYGVEGSNSGDLLCKCEYNLKTFSYDGCESKSACMEYVRRNYWEGVLGVEELHKCCSKDHCNDWLTSDFDSDTPQPGSSGPEDLKKENK